MNAMTRATRDLPYQHDFASMPDASDAERTILGAVLADNSVY